MKAERVRSPVRRLAVPIALGMLIAVLLVICLTVGSISSTAVAAPAIASNAKAVIAMPATPFTDCDSIAGVSKSECEALVALFEGTDGSNWITHTDWLVTNNPCAWYGVTCDATGVHSIFLYGNRLAGPIPSEVKNLTNTVELNFDNNQLSGTIPSEIGSLAALQVLLLNGNQLTGTIPATLGNLPMLNALGLSGNQLDGSIPVELADLNNLELLFLSSNRLSGTIPSELGSLSFCVLLMCHLDNGIVQNLILGSVQRLCMHRAQAGISLAVQSPQRWAIYLRFSYCYCLTISSVGQFLWNWVTFNLL